ncbi:MAG TPA: TAXI family TRAP transporter solute-binding subunit [Burkholderiales bacterium]|nr:TAXI family TRAP transporter solute-binding subunit [Burkholderiales bacterium]
MSETLMVLVLGTATPGGGFPVYGDAFASAVNGQEKNFRIEARNTKGSTENLPLLEAGKLDLALVAGELASEALARPGTPHRIVCAMYASPGMFIVLPSSPVERVSDLRGKPVVLGTQASGITVLGRTVLRSLGIEVQEITLQKAEDGPPLLREGKAAAVWGAGVGWPAFGALAKEGGRFVGLAQDEIETVLKKNPALQRVTLPANSYAGQSQALPSVGSWSYVFARPGLAEETGYRLARAIHRAEPALGASLLQARETTLANTLSAAPRRDLLHPGVQRYLREIGLLR